MAVWTGLEPAASRVTGGRYNQLNYHSVWIDLRTNVYTFPAVGINLILLGFLEKI